MAERPKIEVERWTPKMAEAALGKNEVNRNIRDAKVEQYSRDMKEGRWNFCTAPIVFGADGRLLDGQHRLHAQLKAGVPMEWIVVREVPEDAQTTIDTGIPRSLSDVLSFKGERNSQLLGATARIIRHVEKGTISRGRYTTSNEEVLDTLESHQDIRHSVDIVIHRRLKSMTPIYPSVLAAAHWLIMQVNGVEEADSFITRVMTLHGEQEGSPVLALARRANEIKRQQMRVNFRDALALVIKAWNYDAENKKANKLALYSKTGEFVMPEVKKREIPLEGPADDEAVE